MMYVICFYWQGDRWQEQDHHDPVGYKNVFDSHLKKTGKIDRQLASKYVNVLYKEVRDFASEEFKFVCFTNENLTNLDENIEIRPFEMVTRSGHLPRMYMFSREAGLFGHQVLSLDLDIVIVGSLKDIMGYRGLLCVRSNKYGNLDGDIISFKAGEKTERIFWKPFIEDVNKAKRVSMGRDHYWMRHVIGDTLWDDWKHVAPGQIIDYKRQVRGKENQQKILKDVSIISCNGAFRPHQINEKWINTNKYWNPYKRWDFLNKMIQSHGLKKGAEVGTGEGENVKRLMKVNPDLKMIEVAFYSHMTKKRRDYMSGRTSMERFQKNIRPYKQRVKVIWKPSMEAVKKIPDNYLDFVFIDANHSYFCVLEDIREWRKKVKLGGMIAGHDYNPEKFPGVVKAVKDSFLMGDFKLAGYDNVWYYIKGNE